MSAGTVASLGQALLTIGANAVPATSTLTKFRGFVEGIGEEINSMGNKFSMAGGAIKATTALIANKAIGTVSSIEHASHEAMLIAGKTKETWAPVDAMIEKIGMTTINTQVQVADAVRTIAQAGYSEVSQLNPIINNSRDLALALGSDLKSASGVLISAMESFKGLGGTTESKLKNITDMLGNVAAASRIDFPDLQAFMQQLTGMVNLEDANPKEILAAFGAINQVMGNGAMAAAGLRQGWDMLNRMSVRSDFTKEILPQLKEMGLTADMVNPRVVGLTEAVKRLGEAGMFKNAKASLWFGVQGKNALGLLANNIGMTKKITSEMDRMGSVASRSATMIDSLWGRGMIWTSLLEQMWKKLGEGLLEAGVDKWMKDATGAFEKFVGWLTKNKVVVAEVVIAFSKFGGALLAIGLAMKTVGFGISLLSSLFSIKGLAWMSVLAVVTKWFSSNSSNLRAFKADVKSALATLETGNLAGAFDQLKKSADANVPILGSMLGLLKEAADAAVTMWDRLSNGQDVLQKGDKKSEGGGNRVLSFLETAKEKLTSYGTFLTNIGVEIATRYTAMRDGLAAIWSTSEDSSTKVAKSIKFVFGSLGDGIMDAFRKIASETGPLMDVGRTIGKAIAEGIGEVITDSLGDVFLKWGLADTGGAPQRVKMSEDPMMKAFGVSGFFKEFDDKQNPDTTFSQRMEERARSGPLAKTGQLVQSMKSGLTDIEAIKYAGYSQMELNKSMGSKSSKDQLESFLLAQNKVPGLRASNVLDIANASSLNSKASQDTLKELKIKGTVLEIEGSKLALLITGTQEFLDGVNKAQGKSLKAVALGTRP